MALRLEVALAPVRRIVAQPRRCRHHARLDSHQHVHVFRDLVEVVGHLRRLVGRVHQHLVALHILAQVVDVVRVQRHHHEQAGPFAGAEQTVRLGERIDWRRATAAGVAGKRVIGDQEVRADTAARTHTKNKIRLHK